jgi:hypothetical protein
MHPATKEPGTFNFGIVNRREQAYNVEYTLRDGGGDGEVSYQRLKPVGFRAVSAVTCNQSENAENSWSFGIRHTEAPADTESGMEFNGSECGV